MTEPPEKDPLPLRAEPVTTGSDGTQTPSDGRALVPIVGTVPVDQRHMGAALSEHADARSPTAMAFAIAAFRDAEASRNALIQHLESANRDSHRFRDLYHEEITKNAVLEERTRASSRLRRFQLWAFGVGGLLAGLGLSESWASKSLFGVGGLILAFGLVLMVVGSPFFSRSD